MCSLSYWPAVTDSHNLSAYVYTPDSEHTEELQTVDYKEQHRTTQSHWDRTEAKP